MPKMTREEFEEIASDFVGSTVESVTYYEIAYESGQAMWSCDPEFDSLDYGFDLVVNSGRRLGIIWGSEFTQYGVSMSSRSINSQLQGVRRWEVTRSSRWRELIGREVLSTRIKWSWVKESGLLKRRIYYPQDLELSFSGDRQVYVSALEIEKEKPHEMADNIVVFFDQRTARKYGVGG